MIIVIKVITSYELMPIDMYYMYHLFILIISCILTIVIYSAILTSVLKIIIFGISSITFYVSESRKIDAPFRILRLTFKNIPLRSST